MNKTVNISVHRHNIHQWIRDFGVHILAIVMSVLRSTDSDYIFGIFNLFWYQRRTLLIIHVRYYPCIYTNKGGYCTYHRSRQFLFVVLNPDKISTISKYIDHFTTYNDQLTITVNNKNIVPVFFATMSPIVVYTLTRSESEARIHAYSDK